MNDLTLEILKAIQADLADVRREQKSVRVELSVIREHMMPFCTSTANDQADTQALHNRVERIEKRLELQD